MRTLFPLLGFLTMVGAITTSSPEPGDLCTGVAKAGSIVISVTSTKEKVVDPPIAERPLAANNVIFSINATFMQCMEQASEFPQISAKDFIHNITQYTAGEVHPEDIHKILKSLNKRVGIFLKNSNEMHACFDSVQTEAIFRDTKRSRDSLRLAFGDMQQLRTLVQGAQDATVAQIRDWSQTSKDLTILEMTSPDCLEDPIFKWMAKKALAQWKAVPEKYSKCPVLGLPLSNNTLEHG